MIGDWFSDLWERLNEAIPNTVAFLCLIAPWALPLIVLLVVARVIVVLPLRRRERAQAFLDLLEMEIERGQSPENLIVEVAPIGDKALGKDFTRLAARIRAGDSLGGALSQMPGFLPETVTAMLQAGEQVRDIRKVLLPCRTTLAVGPSRAMGAFNYLPVLSPVLPILAIAQFLLVFIVPKFQELFRDLLGNHVLPASTRLLLTYADYLAPLNLAIGAVMLTLFSMSFKHGRAAWMAFYTHLLKPIGDQILFRLSWRRKRMQRDFSAMLAVLLDAGMPEVDAVTLSAQSTANRVFTTRAHAIVQRLRQGVKLTEAIRALDDTGEFQWRLANAAHTGTGFLRALQGWHDALEAKAFQQEQAVSQAISTALIVLNGALACLIALAIFQPMIAVIQEGSMW